MNFTALLRESLKEVSLSRKKPEKVKPATDLHAFTDADEYGSDPFFIRVYLWLSLFPAEGVDGVQTRCLPRGPEAKDDPDCGRDANPDADGP